MVEQLTVKKIEKLEQEGKTLMECWLLPPVHPPSKSLGKAAHALFGEAARNSTLTTASRVRVRSGAQVARGDVVLLDGAQLDGVESTSRGYVVAQLWFHLAKDKELWHCVSPWPIYDEGEQHVKVRTHDDPVLVRTASVLAPLVHMRTNRSCLVLLPWRYRMSA